MLPIDHFHRQARLTPDAIAAECGEATISYAALRARVTALAAGLQALDGEPGSRVGVCCLNHIDHLVAFLAVLAAGKVWVPLYPKNAAEELRRGIDFTEASIVIADEAGLPLVKGVSARIVPVSGDGTTHHALEAEHVGGAPKEHFPTLHETQAIKFTGGSTGTPKGVMQPYRAWNACLLAQTMAWGLRKGDRFLAAAPITHGTSTYLLPTLATGGTVVIMDRPRPADVVRALSEGGITTTFLPPTLIYMMMQETGVGDREYPALRSLIYGSAPMRVEEIARAQATFGPVIASTYGQTEAPQIATFISPDDMARDDLRGSVGRAIALARVEVLDDDGAVLPVGEMGEIAIRGDLVMTGYWRQPEASEEALRNGWLRTGDLGTFDEAGYLTIKGRSKDVVITGGFNVYPADVEPVIASHATVGDCAVFGVPDDKWGEAIHAAVEWAPGSTGDPDEVIAFVKAKIGSVKTPKSIRVYERLPRNAYGKLQKQVLVDNAIAEQTTGTESAKEPA